MREILQSMMILIVNVGKNILSENDQQLCMTSAPDTAVNPVQALVPLKHSWLEVLVALVGVDKGRVLLVIILIN